MKIAMIAAMADNRVIGANNTMPWHLPADLRHFKQLTLGKPVIMGRKTYESIGKALPGRPNIVISSQRDYRVADATTVESIDAALTAATALVGENDEVMVIGGGKVYSALLSQADILYLTFIHTDVAGDTQFPDYREAGHWLEISRQCHTADEKNPYAYDFVTLERHTG